MEESIEIAIAIVGYKAAGKDRFCAALVERYGFHMVSTGDIIREIAHQEGITEPTTADLQDIGDRARRESQDNGYWVHRLIGVVQERGWTRVVLNGIRNPVEVETLKKILGNRLTLVGMVAPTVIRAERFMKRFPGKMKTLEEFVTMDDRDRGLGEPPEGQQVDRAYAFVPFTNIYNNNGTKVALDEWIDTFMKRFV